MISARTKSIMDIGAESTHLREDEVAYTSFDEDIRFLVYQCWGSYPGYHMTNQVPYHPWVENIGLRDPDGQWRDCEKNCMIKIELQELIGTTIRVQIHMYFPKNQILLKTKHI